MEWQLFNGGECVFRFYLLIEFLITYYAQKYGHHYPTWALLARDYLAIMALSVLSKRAFSAIGITISNRLKGDIVEALRCLKCLYCQDLFFFLWGNYLFRGGRCTQWGSRRDFRQFRWVCMGSDTSRWWGPWLVLHLLGFHTCFLILCDEPWLELGLGLSQPEASQKAHAWI